MKPMLVVALLGLAASGRPVEGAPLAGSDLPAIYAQLARQTAPYRFRAPSRRFEIEAGRLVGERSETLWIRGAYQAGDELGFALIRDSHQINYRMDAAGKPVEPGDLVQNEVFCTQVTLRRLQTTGDLVGVAVSRGGKAAGYTQVARMRSEGDSLHLILSSTGYEDGYSAGHPSGWKPAYLVSDYSIRSDGAGKPVLVRTSEGYEYDTVADTRGDRYARIETPYETEPAPESASWATTPGRASTRLDELATWLEAHVVGRTLRTETTARLDQGKVETDFRRRTTYGPLMRVGDTLALGCVHRIEQVRYDLDAEGRRVPTSARVENRVLLQEYDFRQRLSTQEILGHVRTVGNSHPAGGGGVSAVRAALGSDGLRLETTPLVYGDYYAAGGGYYPGGGTSTTELRVVDGRLQAKNVDVAFAVDPKTLERLNKTQEAVYTGLEE